MLAVRSFFRAAPRVAIRSAALRHTSRTATPRFAIPQRTSLIRSFATTRIWREPAGDSDAELSAKLQHERDLEVQSRDPKKMPQELEDFLSDSQFSVEDKPGTENIKLTKKFGNEIITVECSITDMNAATEAYEDDEDTSLSDEDFNPDAAAGGKKGTAVDGAPTTEDLVGETDTFPLNLRITIEKPGVGATNIIAQAADGEVEIANVQYWPSAELLNPKTIEAENEAGNIYDGPPFQHLDLEVQQMYATYIEERGINAQLTLFLQQYVDYKEQREYVGWLENIKRFIDA